MLVALVAYVYLLFTYIQTLLLHTNLAVLVFATLNNIMLIKAILKLLRFSAYNFVPNPVTNSPIGTNNLTPYSQKPNIYLYIYIYIYIYKTHKRNMDFAI